MISLNLTKTQSHIIKIVGYPTFFICCFFFFLLWTFPADRFVPLAEKQLTDVLGRNVSIGDMEISPLGSVTLEWVEIEVPQDEKEVKQSVSEETANKGGSKKTKNGQKGVPIKPPAPKYLIEEMNIDVGMFSLLMGDIDIEIEMDFLGGEVEIAYMGAIKKKKEAPKGENVQAKEVNESGNKRNSRRNGPAVANNVRGGNSPAGTSNPDSVKEEENPLYFKMVAKGLNMVQFWDLKEMLPLPLFGTMDFELELDTKTGKFQNAEGKLIVDLKNASFGKGQTQVEIPNLGPMTVESIALKKMLLNMKVKEGTCSVEKFNVVSKDIDMGVEGDIKFNDPFSRSMFNLYFTFKLLDGYAAKSDKAKTLTSLVPGFLSTALRRDGFLGFAYEGVYKKAKFRPRKVFRGSRNIRNSVSRRPRSNTVRSRPSSRIRSPRVILPSVPSTPPPPEVEKIESSEPPPPVPEQAPPPPPEESPPPPQEEPKPEGAYAPPPSYLRPSIAEANREMANRESRRHQAILDAQ